MHRFFPPRRKSGNPIGQRVRGIGSRDALVVGVVERLNLGAVSEKADPVMYFPYTQVPEGLTFNRRGTAVVVRTDGDPMAVAPAVRATVKRLDPSTAVFNVLPLAERLGRTFEQPRFYTIALALFAGMALLTAVLGVYGVQAYAVERRTAELGVRRALGAEESHLVRLVMMRGLLLGGVGAAIGIPLAASGAGPLQALLFGVQPLDPVTFVAMPLAVLSLAVAASWQPARRALRVDPASALRCE